ncbi:sacsin N-terminal ATP-binding-like domain-containing protein [Streptomyces sp. NPDC054932]
MSDLARHLLALQDTLVREHAQAPGLFGEIARMEDLLADTYRNRVPYELLQNSDDAGSVNVVVEDLGDGRYTWSNDGRLLHAGDVEALCRSASSTKLRGGGSIGYRGIGFKSLAALATRIEVRSAGVAFTFDKAASAALLGEPAGAPLPLIRIPSDIRDGGRTEGTGFTITCRPGSDGGLDAIDPVSALFLRNVTRIETRSAHGTRHVQVDRGPSEVVLRLHEGDARFGVLVHGTATVAVPLNARALAMTGVRGRLACFLPLDDEVGLPVVVSGDLLTDPSRTHAVVADASTRQVLADAARALADRLRSPGDPVSERLWELLLEGEDIRSLLVSAGTSAATVLLTALREEMTARRPSFAYSSLPLEPQDVPVLFPAGAPAALYAQRNQAAARAAKAVLGLRTLDFTGVVSGPGASGLSEALRGRLGRHFGELARTHGRTLAPAERELVEAVTDDSGTPAAKPAALPAPAPAPRTGAGDTPGPGSSFPVVMERWRTAEVATMEFLGGRGWNLSDVSGQNVGYDLEGTDAEARPVRIEVKKVDRPDARFAMTNNEMSLMLTAPGGYLLAVVVGDGRHAKLLLLDPSSEDLPRERVCRRWDWEFTDWARFARVVE